MSRRGELLPRLQQGLEHCQLIGLWKLEMLDPSDLSCSPPPHPIPEDRQGLSPLLRAAS